MIDTIRNQASAFWKHQTNGQRVTLIVLVVAAAIVIPVIISWATTPSYTVAFSGLSEADAGQIVDSLNASAIPYKLQGVGTILVPSDKVYDVRLSVAQEGIVDSGTVGYELFDTSSLGVTEFTQKVNYQRALEGELERTIMNLHSIEAASVHIVTPEKSLLSSEQSTTTASVTLKTKSSGTLDASQVRAITNLVASSVEGLDPDNVVIVDTDGNLLAGSLDGESAASTTEVDSRRAAEQAAAREIKNKVQSILDSTLGPNKSVVQASVTMDWTSREITTQTFQPTQSAVVSSQKSSESYSSDASSVAGIPGASTNLPTPAATTTAGSTSPMYYVKTEETYNYEVSQSQSTEKVAPGTITQVSLSVLVDGITDTAQLTTIKNAVAAAAGINQTRGDIISVESLAFDRTYYTEQEADLSQSENTDLYIRIGSYVAIAVIVILLLWYISRLFKNLRLATNENWSVVMRPVTEASLGGGISAANLLQNIQQPAQIPSQADTNAALTEVVTRTKAPTRSPEDEQIQKALANVTEQNPATVADIIQMWLSEDEKNNG